MYKRQGLNISVTDKLQMVPISRKATPEQWEAAMIKAIDARFRAASLPEPGAPMELRGREATWDLAAELRPTVLGRSPIGGWPSDPLWPRKLAKARRSAALSPSEAALVMWLYARQLQIDADWAVVRPASSGPGQGPSPAGYNAPALRVRIGADERWIDPACAVCAPFELPPELEGASAIGPGSESTPAPSVGRHEVRVAGDRLLHGRNDRRGLACVDDGVRDAVMDLDGHGFSWSVVSLVPAVSRAARAD